MYGGTNCRPILTIFILFTDNRSKIPFIYCIGYKNFKWNVYFFLYLNYEAQKWTPDTTLLGPQMREEDHAWGVKWHMVIRVWEWEGRIIMRESPFCWGRQLLILYGQVDIDNNLRKWK